MRNLHLIDRALIGMATIVITMTLTTVGLTATSEYQRSQHLSAPDAGTKPDPTESQSGFSRTSGAPIDDPELMRIDRANEHHG